jgi:hypothetical protein
MSNITPRGHGDMQVTDPWGNMESSDFAIPHMKIGQPMTKKGEMGAFNFSNGASHKTLTGVKLLVPHKTRVLYGKTFDSGSRCASDNYHVPSSRIQNPISPSCLTCFAAQWGDDDQRKVDLAFELGKQGNNIRPPLCKETYNPLMVDGGMRPFFAQFQGTNLKEFSEKLLSRLRFEFSQVPPYMVSFDMGLKMASGEYKVYQPEFTNFKILEGEEAERMTNMWHAFSQTAAKKLADAHAQMDAEKHDEVPF